MAKEAKTRGNATFSSGQFDAAIHFFSQAIHLSPSNHLLYSNCSAAYASLHRYSDALVNAQKTVELNPDWAKGYSRLGAAHVGLGRLADAIAAFRKGLELDPSNAALKSALVARSRGPSPLSSFADMFRVPEVWAKLTADPMTRGYLQQSDILQMMQDVRRNPSSLNLYLKDQRMMQVIRVLLNMKMRTGTPDEAAEPVQRPEPEANKEKEPEPEAMDVPDEEKDARERKVEAQSEKEEKNVKKKWVWGGETGKTERGMGVKKRV